MKRIMLTIRNVAIAGPALGDRTRLTRNVTKLIKVGMAAYIFLITSPRELCAGDSGNDHLVPVLGGGLREEYRKLWEPRLLITPGDVGRYVILPGGSGVEGAASIYRQPRREGALAGDYWITRTDTSAYIGQLLPPVDARTTIQLEKVQTKRWDAPLPASTALAVHRLWLTMLLQTASEPNPDIILVDSGTDIFSARNSDGRILEAQSPKDLKENTTALIKIGFLLLDYPVVGESERPKLAAQIEKDALALLRKVKKH